MKINLYGHCFGSSGWAQSAHTDYLNEGNGYLIDVARLTPVDDAFFYGVDEHLGVWAQPDLEHLQQLMRLAYTDADERATKADQARADMATRWTWQHAAQVAHKRFEVF